MNDVDRWIGPPIATLADASSQRSAYVFKKYIGYDLPRDADATYYIVVVMYGPNGLAEEVRTEHVVLVSDLVTDQATELRETALKVLTKEKR